MNLNRVAANGPAIAPVSRSCSAKFADNLLMLLSRHGWVGALIAMFVAIMLVSPASAQTTAPVQTAWRLLDYVAVDYPEAVKGGQIVSPTEYAEMTEFSASARERITSLASSSAKADLARRATALERLIAAKAPAEAVGTAARSLAADLIAAYPVPLAPAVAPNYPRGQALFNQNCASCHAMTGDGKGPKSVGLDPPPIAFIDKARARERSTFAFYQVLEQGIDGTSMESFADRPLQDRWDLALYAGTFAFPASKVAEGERIWKSDAALRNRINMEKLVGMTPAALAANIGEERADAVIAYLRRNPSVVVPQVSGTLTVARARLNEAVTAYAKGDRKGATNLALSAYLDGFEPVEPVLSARDNALMVRIEGAMGALRAAIANGTSPTTVRDQTRALDTLFGEAETVLAPEQASGASSFFGAFTILLREGLEALLIVVAMLAFLRKADRSDVMPYVHGGWVAALVAGAATWAVATYAVEISGASRELTEGFGSVFAALVLLWVTRTAVRMLDNVIDISRYPLPQQEAEAKAKRRIGLGITGLADALLFCGQTYGASPAIETTRRWLGIIRREAYRASAELASEKGCFPSYDACMLDAPNLRSLDEQTRALIASHGLRNGCLTSIAPTGTTSLLAGNVSFGIEPVFAYTYRRRLRQPDGSTREELVEDYAMQVWRRVKGDAPPPDDIFVSAQTLKPSDHVAMQAAAQELVDSSISKTVNCPESITFEDFADIYVEGYRLGCKGLTTYRPNAVTGSVLQVDEEPKPAPSPEPEVALTPRADALAGQTYKLKWPDSAHAVYVTINDVDTPAGRRPFEIFINSKNMEHYAWTLGVTRMISAVFRRGGDVSFVPEELKAVFDPRGGAWIGGRYVPSLLAAIGGVIERHMGLAQPALPLPGLHEDASVASKLTAGTCCPQCGAAGLIKSEGCNSCTQCGFSKCG